MSRVNPFGQTAKSMTLGRHILPNAGCHCTCGSKIPGTSATRNVSSPIAPPSACRCGARFETAPANTGVVRANGAYIPEFANGREMISKK